MGKGPVKRKTLSKIVKTRRQGGYISKKGQRGEGLKFKVETFATVGSFVPGTRVKYAPNPKTPGSKSFARYAKYEKAATVGEALKCGASKADLMWELERGYYKVLAGASSEAQEISAIGQKAYDRAVKVLATGNGPIGCPVNFKDPNAVKRLEKEEEWRKARLQRVEKRARDMNLKVETTEEIEESNENADIRLQRRVAEAICNKKLSSGKKLTEKDVQEALDHWGFTENTSRVNVLPGGQKFVYSDTIGAIRKRHFGFSSTPPTRRYPAMAKLLNRWLADNKPKLAAKFVCTAINLNCNYAGRRHRDAGNDGPSVIRAFGKFTGGRLHYFPKDKTRPRPKLESLNMKDAKSFDLAKNTVVFDGNRAHEVEPFKGERYSAVFFTSSGYAKGKPKDIEFLKKECCFPWPEAGDVAKLKKAVEAM